MMSDKLRHAPDLLNAAAATITSRAKQRDDEQQGERSMGATVGAFNALYGTNLSETQGWMFMVILKAARARQGDLNMDDYVDGSAYFALAGESARMELIASSSSPSTMADPIFKPQSV